MKGACPENGPEPTVTRSREDLHPRRVKEDGMETQTEGISPRIE